MNIDKYVRVVQDFPKKGIAFKDVSTLLENPQAFSECIEALAEVRKDYDKIGAFDARGFLFGSALAYHEKKPLFMLRKKGKLPFATIEEGYGLEYGENTLEVHVDAVRPGEKILLLDDILATGGTMKAGCSLVEQLGGEVVGCQFVLELPELAGREVLSGYDVRSLNVEYCADVIAKHEEKYILVQRLTEPKGLALPGGRREYLPNGLEEASDCARRELREETGFILKEATEIGVYDEPNRDPRGHKISTVYVGDTTGMNWGGEHGKTKTVILSEEEIHARKEEFVFDHYSILEDFLRR